MAQPNLQMAKKPESKRTGATKNKKIDKVTLILMIIFAIIAVITAVVAFNVVRSLVLSWDSTELPGAPVSNTGGQSLEELLPEGTEYVEPLQEAGGPTPQPWDGVSRVTILVMGLDYRDWEAGEVPRTDTMILFTLDPVQYTAGMLSIPRDMWVNIPGFDHGKINTAYFLGEIYNLPGGGPGLAVQTVEEFLGVPINYYAQVDFQAFVDFIDEIGGVDIHVKDELVVDPLGPGNTVKLYEGVQTLDGATALAYARARYTEDGDFDRSKRQQQVIMAVLDNILNFYSLPKLITKAPALYQELSSGVQTNLSLQEGIELAWIVQKIPMDSIKQAAIGPDQVQFGTSPDGLSILKPIPDEIRITRDEIFADGGPISPAAISNDPSELMLEESALVSVQNGTNNEGLAETTGSYFSSLGLTIVEQTNANSYHDATEIIIHDGKPYTVQYLADLLGVPTSRIYNQYEPDSYADVIVILGNDWANNNPMP